MTLDLLITMASQRQATFITRVLLPDERFEVENWADTIHLRRCPPILNWVLEPKNKVNCTCNYPVTFLYNHEKRHGYIDEISHVIRDTPEIIPYSEETLLSTLMLLTLCSSLPILQFERSRPPFYQLLKIPTAP
jgi:hypothetical protein